MSSTAAFTQQDFFDAARNGDAGLLEKILLSPHSTIDVNGRDKDNHPALWLAFIAPKGGFESLSVLLNHGAKSDVKISDNTTSFVSIAINYGRADILSLLVEKGAAVNADDRFEDAPLFRAAEMGREACMLLLLENGADVTQKNSSAATPVHIAAENGHGGVIRILHRHGADLDAQNNGKNTPLEEAVRNRRRDAFDVLLEEGADAFRLIGDGKQSLLMWAVFYGESGMVRALAAHGLDVNYKDADGNTALIWAGIGGKGDIVKLLLDLGADAEHRNAEGKTARQAAQERGHRHVARMLDDKMNDLMRKGLSGRLTIAKPIRLKNSKG